MFGKSTQEGAIIAREGFPFIWIGFGATVICWLAGWDALTMLCGLTTLWVVWFFRNPARIAPDGENLVVAPADGRVLGVETVPALDGDGERLRVAIFMNVFNVHVNRLPVTGRVTDVSYTPGRFINASFDKASIHNERNRITMETPGGHQVSFVQIAGLVARRIVCWARSGTVGSHGDIFGLIRFGSRVDVHLPKGSDVWVDAGQKVTAGETVLGRLP